MLLVDDRAGSGPLLKPLQKMGLECEATTLLYGDFAFEGLGDGGAPVQIGIELKTLSDMIGSIRSGRFTGNRSDGTPGQLPGMMKTYDHAWLVVEGAYSTDAQGFVTHQVFSHRYRGREWKRVEGSMRVAELEKALLTYELCGGIHVRHTADRPATLRLLSTLYRWWTDTALDRHTSHLAPSRAGAIVQLSDVRQALMAWPGMGRKWTQAAEEAFGSVQSAAMARPEQWARLTTKDDKGKTRRFGDAAAQRLHTFLTKGE